MLLSEIDFTDFDVSLELAQRAARSKDQGLEDHLALTAIGDTYRPYAAAHDWLEAHPKWIVEFTGSEGLKYDSLQRALAALSRMQSAVDVQLELEVPTALRPVERPLISKLYY